MDVGGYNRPLHAELVIQVILGCPHLLLNYANKVISGTKRDKSISVKLIKKWYFQLAKIPDCIIMTSPAYSMKYGDIEKCLLECKFLEH